MLYDLEVVSPRDLRIWFAKSELLREDIGYLPISIFFMIVDDIEIMEHHIGWRDYPTKILGEIGSQNRFS